MSQLRVVCLSALSARAHARGDDVAREAEEEDGMSTENTPVYIGTLACGCHVAAAVDEIEHPRHTAKSVAEMIAQGYTISRHTLDDLRSGAVKLHRCVHRKDEQEGFGLR